MATKNRPRGDVKIVVDFETSGKDANACAIGLVRLEACSIVNEYYTLIRPPSSIVHFTHIHGLTWNDLKDAPVFTDIWPEVCKFIEGATAFIAHKASFDRGVLTSCCREFDLDLPELPFLCTVKGSRKCYGLRYNTLSDVCEHLDIALNHHHAASDARACALIYADLIRRGLNDDDMML